MCLKEYDSLQRLRKILRDLSGAGRVAPALEERNVATYGRLAERFKAPVLKTGGNESSP